MSRSPSCLTVVHAPGSGVSGARVSPKALRFSTMPCEKRGLGTFCFGWSLALLQDKRHQPVAHLLGVLDVAREIAARAETTTRVHAWMNTSGPGVRNPDGALSVKIRYAVRRLAGVARPGNVGVARRSVSALRTVRDAGWPPGAGQSKRRDPAHVACGFRRIPPSWRFRRRERAVIAVARLPALCRRHRSRRHHRIDYGQARRAKSSKPLIESISALPRQGSRLSLVLRRRRAAPSRQHTRPCPGNNRAVAY